MMIDPLPDIGRAFSMVLQQERQLNVPSPVNDSMALAFSSGNSNNSGNGNHGGFNNGGRGRGRNNGGGGQGGNKYCIHCKMTNHAVDTCYFKHGFSPSYQPKGKAQANATTGNQDFNMQASGVTQEQFQSLIDLLQQSKIAAQPHSTNSVVSSPLVFNSGFTNLNGKLHNPWVIDTGATDHITHNLQSFSSHKIIKPIPVTLPDGSQAHASILGTLIIPDNLILENVLYIPCFKVNLLSVTCLTRCHYCHLSFYSNSCMILQNHTLKMIGSTELHGGLYVIKSSHPSLQDPHTGIFCNSVVQEPSKLWHMRLGDASDLSLKTISKQFPYIQYRNNGDPCDACHYAKQRKLPFPNSSTKSNAPFDILHADIWGPFSIISFLGHKYFLTLVDDFSRFT